MGAGPCQDSTESRDRYYQDLYAKPPDFKQLARQDPDFAATWESPEHAEPRPPNYVHVAD